MEPVRQVAMICVGRAVFFGALAIGLLMLSFAFDPVLAFKCGAITTLTLAGALTIKAAYAHSQKPKHTEVWLHLDERWRPGNEPSNRAFRQVLREVYVHFARVAFTVACGFFAVSVGLAIVGVEPYGYEVASR